MAIQLCVFHFEDLPVPEAQQIPMFFQVKAYGLPSRMIQHRKLT